jgi:hypothetical protein
MDKKNKSNKEKTIIKITLKPIKLNEQEIKKWKKNIF